MSPLIAAMEAAWSDLKSELAAAKTWLVALVEQLWTADEQVVMQKLQTALTNFATSLQNTSPGISAEAMGAELIASVALQFAEIGAQLAYEDILLVVAAVVKEINPSQTPGNGGNAPAGNL